MPPRTTTKRRSKQIHYLAGAPTALSMIEPRPGSPTRAREAGWSFDEHASLVLTSNCHSKVVRGVRRPSRSRRRSRGARPPPLTWWWSRRRGFGSQHGQPHDRSGLWWLVMDMLQGAGIEHGPSDAHGAGEVRHRQGATRRKTSCYRTLSGGTRSCRSRSRRTTRRTRWSWRRWAAGQFGAPGGGVSAERLASAAMVVAWRGVAVSRWR